MVKFLTLYLQILLSASWTPDHYRGKLVSLIPRLFHLQFLHELNVGKA